MVKPLHMAKEFYVQAPIPRFGNDLLLNHSPSQACSLCYCDIHLSPHGFDWNCDVVIHDTGNGCNVSNIQLKSQNYPIQIYLKKTPLSQIVFLFLYIILSYFYSILQKVLRIGTCALFRSKDLRVMAWLRPISLTKAQNCAPLIYTMHWHAFIITLIKYVRRVSYFGICYRYSQAKMLVKIMIQIMYGESYIVLTMA